MNELDRSKWLNDPSVSYWLKDAIKASGERDLLDAYYDAKALFELMELEMEAFNKSLLNRFEGE